MTSLARQIVLAAWPHGKPKLTDFRLEETAIPTPKSGQVLLSPSGICRSIRICGAAWMTGSPTRSRSSSAMS